MEILERFADGLATGEELHVARLYAEAAASRLFDDAILSTRAKAVFAKAAGAVYEAMLLKSELYVAQLAAEAVGLAKGGAATDENSGGLFKAWTASKGTQAFEIEQTSMQLESEEQAHLVQDIRGSASVAAWRTPEVVAFAAEIYEHGSFDLMPALGAALSDAGCTEPSVLEHCSLPIHVKGCWLVDALLGKA